MSKSSISYSLNCIVEWFLLSVVRHIKDIKRETQLLFSNVKKKNNKKTDRDIWREKKRYKRENCVSTLLTQTANTHIETEKETETERECDLTGNVLQLAAKCNDPFSLTMFHVT